MWIAYRIMDTMRKNASRDEIRQSEEYSKLWIVWLHGCSRRSWSLFKRRRRLDIGFVLVKPLVHVVLTINEGPLAKKANHILTVSRVSTLPQDEL